MNDGISASCVNGNSATLKKVAAEITSKMKCFLYLEKKKHFMMKQLVMGLQHVMKWLWLVIWYKSHNKGSVIRCKELNKVFQHSPVILILCHNLLQATCFITLQIINII